MDTLFTIELRRIMGLASALSGAQRPYVIAWIGGRLFGRSHILAAGADELDLTAEPEPWVNVIRSPEAAPELRFEVWDDHGDLAPQLLTGLGVTLPSGVVAGDMTLGGAALRVLVRVTRRDVPRIASSVVPRVATGASTRATIAVPNTLIVELSDVRGLCKPGHVPAGVAHPRRAEPLTGYLSEDNLGRIYLNRDLDGDYARDQQQIEVSARVTVLRGRLPASAKIKWTVLDPDDVFDADSAVHREAAPIIDENDHDASGAPTGALSADNQGSFDHSPRWEEVSGHSLEVVSDTEAKTSIVSNESKVLIHCPNCAGDDLIVCATVEADVPVEVFPARTGVMTVWHRIDVEYVRMRRAQDLPVDQVPAFFEEARAELNFSEPNDQPYERYMVPRLVHHDVAATRYIDRHAVHAHDPGWFVLVAAIEAEHPSGMGRSENIFRGRVRLRDDIPYTGHQSDYPAYLLKEYFTVRGDMSNAEAVLFNWDGHEAGFIIAAAVVMELSGETWTRLWIWPNDHTSKFEGLDGSHTQAYATRRWYSPRHHHDGNAWGPGGYGIPDVVRATVSSAGASSLEGVSPPLEVGGDDYFCGRTVVFTHHHALWRAGHPTSDFAAEAVAVIAHELVHAFGMPHRCGFFDHRTPRAQTCHMNYRFDWGVDPADITHVVPGFNDRIGPHLCARHLREMRRVHLEENDALEQLNGW